MHFCGQEIAVLSYVLSYLPVITDAGSLACKTMKRRFHWRDNQMRRSKVKWVAPDSMLHHSLGSAHKRHPEEQGICGSLSASVNTGF